MNDILKALNLYLRRNNWDEYRTREIARCLYVTYVYMADAVDETTLHDLFWDNAIDEVTSEEEFTDYMTALL